MYGPKGLQLSLGHLNEFDIASLVAWRHGFNDLDVDQQADGEHAVTIKAYGRNCSMTVRGDSISDAVEKLVTRLEG